MPFYNGLYLSEEDPTPTDPAAGACGVPNLSKPPTPQARERWYRYLFVSRDVPTSTRRTAGGGWLFWSGVCVGLGSGFILAAIAVGYLR